MPLKKTYSELSMVQILENAISVAKKVSRDKQCTVGMNIELSKVINRLNHVLERVNGKES